MIDFEITYTAPAWMLGQPRWTTKLKADNEEEAKAYFKRHYPTAVFISIKKV